MGLIVRYPADIIWSAACEEYCEQRKIYLAHPKRIRGVYKNGEVVTFRSPFAVESYGTLCKNSFFSIGAFSYAQSFLHPDICIGRYCSIASGLEVMAAQHPIKRFTTSPITYLPRWAEHATNEFGGSWKIKPFAENLPAPTIGNDVWIGQQVLLKGGITIGDGACIASRAVVTKDVAPYSIVGGTPAKVIRMRFSERQIARLLPVRWWRYRYSDLPQEHWDDIDSFLDALQIRVEDGLIRAWEPGKWNLGPDLAQISTGLPGISSEICQVLGSS